MTTDDLLVQIRDEAAAPPLVQAWTDQKIIDACNRQLVNVMAALFATQQQYFVDFIDTAMVANQDTYPLPTRAMASGLRAVLYKDSSGNLTEPLALLSPKDFWEWNVAGSSPQGVMLNADTLTVRPAPASSAVGSLRLYYNRRPGALILGPGSVGPSRTNALAAMTTGSNSPFPTITNVVAAGGNVTYSLADTTGVVDGTSTVVISGCTNSANNGTFTITSHSSNASITVANASGVSETPPAGTVANWGTVKLTVAPASVFAVGASCDITGYLPPLQLKAKDVAITAVSGNYVSFAPSSIVSATGLLGALVTGDYLTLARESYTPNLPVEWHTYLAMRVVADIQRALGRRGEAGATLGEAEVYRKSLLDISETRVAGNPQKVRGR